MDEKKLVLHPKKVKGNDGYKTFSVRLPEELVTSLSDISAQTGYSRNELINRFLTYAVDNCTIADK